ncbi:AbrB/MazE/SpoVT family DNA-binding domain-containing protein, partial [Agrobacterium pusense]
SPGSSVDFVRAPDGRIVLVRADKKQPLTRFAKLRGHAGEGLGTDAIMALTRGDE